MLFFTETTLLHRDRRTLTVKQEATPTGFCYVGRIDGLHCVSSPTREGAICALLRRVAYARAGDAIGCYD